MRLFASLTGLVAASVLATAAGAAQVTLTGAISSSSGSSSAAAIGTNQVQQVTGSGSNVGFQADVRIINTIMGDTQTFSVCIDALRFDKWVSGTKSITLEIVQDFDVSAASTGAASATQTFDVTANVPRTGQTTSFVSDAFHENVQLPRFSGQNATSGGGWTDIDCGTSAAVSIMQSGVYRIRALYTFTLSSSNSNWMSLEVLPGQGDEVCTTAALVLVPLPPAAWAGLGGLALVACRTAGRRRGLRAAC